MAEHRKSFERWLLDSAARMTSIAALVDSFCVFLNRQDFAIRRCNLGGETVHPMITNVRHVWFDRPADPGPFNPALIVSRHQHMFGKAMIDELQFVGKVSEERYRQSPFFHIDRHGELHLPISPPESTQPYAVFDELAAAGYTDYFGTNLGDISGLRHRIAFNTDSPGGFTDAQLDELRLDLRYFALALRSIVECDLKQRIARIFLGKDPGARVCGGMIAPGDVIALDAAIWYSDLRDFSSLAETLEAEQLLSELNDYFACVTGAVDANGGEILKFIGDAVLAIFPVELLGGPRNACAAALDAAAAKREALDALNERRRENGKQSLGDGLALHFGRVQYGNIGARERLDFTVIGRAVNIAARVQAQCGGIGEAILCTDEFSQAAMRPMRSLGEANLKGVAIPIEIGVPIP